MICPRCGSENVDVQVFQENTGSLTTARTKSKYKEKGHGCLWWIFIGSWWWIFDLCLWIFAFVPRLLIQIFKKKKYKGSSTTVEKTTNNITYRRVCVCKNCGHNWSL